MGRRKYSDQDLEEMARQVEASALQYWELCDEEDRAAAAGWYPVAHAEAQILAEHFKVSVVRSSAVIAVLSPMTRWQGNLDDAYAVFEGARGKHCLPSNEAKARRIIDGEAIGDVIGGRKVTSFWLNIADPLGFEGTTNDTWIARAFGLSQADLFERYGVYDAVTRGLRRAAKTLGVLPSTLQAGVWLKVRQTWERNNQDWAAELPVPF